jgi:hypothetical protein
VIQRLAGLALALLWSGAVLMPIFSLVTGVWW